MTTTEPPIWKLLERASRPPYTTTDQVKKAEFALGWPVLVPFDGDQGVWRHFGQMLRGNYRAILSLNIGTLDALEELNDTQLQLMMNFANPATAQAFRQLVHSELEATGWGGNKSGQ